jgi:dephospho-CoA kinase
MQKALQIGITGGIGSGKSTVCKIFKVLGIPVYDADSRAKAVMTTDGILIDSIQKEFGTLSYKQSGELDRDYLAKEVFTDTAKLKILNALVHPRVAVDYNNWVLQHADKPYLLKEAALLIESGSYQSLDKLIVVQAPEALRIKRVLLRDVHRTEAQVREIMASQLSEEGKASYADVLIQNDETHSLIDQVLTLHQQWANINH